MKVFISKLHSLKPEKKRVFSVKGVITFIILASVFATTLLVTAQKAQAALITSASVQMSNSIASTTGVTYTVLFNFPSTTSIKCFTVSFGDTTAVTPPATGMTTTSSVGTIDGTTNGGLTPGSWTYYATGNGIFQFEDSSGQATTATQIKLSVTTVTNPSGGTFYSIVNSYSAVAAHVCSGAVDASNVMANITSSAGVAASATVNPSVSFSLANYGTAVNGATGTLLSTATSSTIPFGVVTPATAYEQGHTATVSTNGAGGYVLYIRYTGAMSNGVQTIADAAGTNASPGSFGGSGSTSSFGYTTDNSQETGRFTSNTWVGFTTTNQEVAKNASAVSGDASHIGYELEASNTQQPGTYTTTVIYTVAPSD